jgi:TonB family protein
MRHNRSSILAITLCIALVLHAAVIIVSTHVPAWYLFGILPVVPAMQQGGDLTVFLDERIDGDPTPDRIGEKKGESIGTHRAEGEKPLYAPKANNDQPSLDRDPRGVGMVTPPSPSQAPVGQAGRGGTAGSATSIRTPQLPDTAPPLSPADRPDDSAPRRPGAVAVAVPGVDVREPTPTEARPERPDPDGLLPPPPRQLAAVPPPAATVRPMPAAVAPAPAVPTLPAPPEPMARADNPGDGRKPGAPVPPAGAAQQSDSETDAFSRLEVVVRRDGSLEPQFGRKVKTRRPQIPISGLVDAALGAQSVTMKVRINPDGTVANVTVSRSSGSRSLDQPCVVSMYDWWFEPLTDRTGKPIPDTVFFTINFR